MGRNRCKKNTKQATRIQKTEACSPPPREDREFGAHDRPFNLIMVCPGGQRWRVRKLMPSENGGWKIQFKNREIMDNVSDECLESVEKDPVASVDELLEMLKVILAGFPAGLAMAAVQGLVMRQFKQRIVPQVLGYNSLLDLAYDPTLRIHFRVEVRSAECVRLYGLAPAKSDADAGFFL